MNELWNIAVRGAAAGLGVAMPLGAMGVLLIQEGMRERRGAVAAAGAVAVVDMAYAALATALGPLVASVLSGVEAWVRLVSAIVLAAIAYRGLRASTGPVAGSAASAGTPPAGAVRTFTRFAALTLVNPTTALYFAALTTAQGAALSGGTAGAVFVAGVFLASLVWQQSLVAVSGFAGARIGTRARAWTFRVGYGLVAVYAVKVALPLP
ncbi:LysE family transporter [Streptomyces actinomycinicus]|uniref:LysE family transporter n=1 Tax=Streptomyces actinomycinicus TaxID=1695166 RepID=A0A937JPH4_9ACTN|nr:LysE family transporter [Streptomyces actinomycinicus]MBL1083472.1 LysE family transporter [Streptomyces actinomycinicus]